LHIFHAKLDHANLKKIKNTFSPTFYNFSPNLSKHHKFNSKMHDVVTLALGLQPKQGLAKV